MKKNVLLVLITAIICIVGTASAAYVYTAKDIGYTPQDENWEVSNASEALSSLKSDLNNVNQNVTEYKQQITEALASQGVEVNENSSMSDITSGITNMSSGILGQASGYYWKIFYWNGGHQMTGSDSNSTFSDNSNGNITISNSGNTITVNKTMKLKIGFNYKVVDGSGTYETLSTTLSIKHNSTSIFSTTITQANTTKEEFKEFELNCNAGDTITFGRTSTGDSVRLLWNYVVY